VVVPNYFSQFHEYAVEWTPTSLTYLVDGTPYVFVGVCVFGREM
jgi:beta-glucanase (GH16 family)